MEITYFAMAGILFAAAGIVFAIVMGVKYNRTRRTEKEGDFQRAKAEVSAALQGPDRFDLVHDWSERVRSLLTTASSRATTVEQSFEVTELKSHYTVKAIWLFIGEYETIMQRGSSLDAVSAFYTLHSELYRVSNYASWSPGFYTAEQIDRLDQIKHMLQERIILEAQNLTTTARDNFQDFKFLRKLIKVAKREFDMSLRPQNWSELVLRHIEYPTAKQFGHLPKYRSSKQQHWHIEAIKVLTDSSFNSLRAAELIAILNRPDQNGESPMLEAGLADCLGRLTERFVSYRNEHPVASKVAVAK